MSMQRALLDIPFMMLLEEPTHPIFFLIIKNRWVKHNASIFVLII